MGTGRHLSQLSLLLSAGGFFPLVGPKAAEPRGVLVGTGVCVHTWGCTRTAASTHSARVADQGPGDHPQALPHEAPPTLQL